MALLALKTTSIFVITLLVVLAMWSSQAQCRTLNEVPMLERHEQWMARYGRIYKDDKEKEIRFKIFKRMWSSLSRLTKLGISRTSWASMHLRTKPMRNFGPLVMATKGPQMSLDQLHLNMKM